MGWTKAFAKAYDEACRLHDPDHRQKVSRLDWGPWVDWARPDSGHTARPSWVGGDDVPVVASIRDLDVGERS